MRCNERNFQREMLNIPSPKNFFLLEDLDICLYFTAKKGKLFGMLWDVSFNAGVKDLTGNLY